MWVGNKSNNNCKKQNREQAVCLPPVLIGVNELPPGYPWSGCSPAEPASVSPGLVVRLSNERIM